MTSPTATPIPVINKKIDLKGSIVNDEIIIIKNCDKTLFSFVNFIDLDKLSIYEIINNYNYIIEYCSEAGIEISYTNIKKDIDNIKKYYNFDYQSYCDLYQCLKTIAMPFIDKKASNNHLYNDIDHNMRLGMLKNNADKIYKTSIYKNISKIVEINNFINSTKKLLSSIDPAVNCILKISL